MASRLEMLVATAALLVLVAPSLVPAFPDGAPADACVKARANQPYHGQAEPQPPHTNPFLVTASDHRYGPGSKITVTIAGNRGQPFRGFFLQARDAETNEWLGTWEEHKPYTNGLPECASITHGDNKDKAQVTLTWRAPQHTRGGEVYFTGAVVQDYAHFWVNLVSNVAK